MVMILLFLVFSFFKSKADENPNPYSQLINRTLSTHKNAINYAQWKNSGVSPEELFEKAQSSTNPKAELQSLCNALIKSSPEDSSLFFSEILALKTSENSSCFRILEKNIRTFYQKTAPPVQALDSFSTSLSLNSFDESPLWTNDFLEIDTIGGPRFVTADLEDKKIALTFDDGPHRVLTEKLLKILNDSGLKVTFFVVGKNVKRYPDIVKKSADEGHTIGTHSWSHKQLPKIDAGSAIKEIDGGFHALLEHQKEAAPFFRFPYGARSKYLTSYLKENDIADFFWTIDTLDWKIPNPQKLYKYALEQIENSGHGIVLFHDVQPQTIEMLPALLQTLKTRGYSHVTLYPKEMMQP